MMAVTLKNALIGVSPKLIAASSIEGLICCKIAALERSVNGKRRITKAKIIMAGVPISTRGRLLKAKIKIIPIIEPGITKGSIVMVSSTLVNGLRLRTVKYENNSANARIITNA